MIIFFTFIFIFDFTVAQVHNLPVIDPLSTIQCYHCDQHNFPQCLSAPVTCQGAEVCSITYSSTETHIKCQRAADCTKDTAHPSAVCLQGGYQVHPGQCEQCCSTSTCVSSLTGVLQTAYNTGFICPGSCSLSTTSSCLTSGTHCAVNQFCELKQVGHLTVTGTCKNNHDLQKCTEDKVKHPCVDQTACVLDCCTTSSCLNSHFTSNNGLTIGTTSLPNTVATSSAVNDPSIECMSCSGDECAVTNNHVYCQQGFCLESVEYRSDDSIFTTKRCSSRVECEQFWLKTSHAVQQQCLDAKSSLFPVNQAVTCNYCCNNDRCNDHLTIHGVHLFS